MKRVPLIDIGMNPICMDCARFKKANTPFMEGAGDFQSGIVLLFDRVSMSDDERGDILSGKSGDKLYKILNNTGFRIFEDFWLTSAVKCFSPSKPKPKHCEYCSTLLKEELKNIKPQGKFSPYATINEGRPKGIICFGSDALRTLCPGALSSYDANVLAGDVIPYKGMWVGVHHSLTMMMAKMHDQNYNAWFSRTLNSMLRKIDESKSVDSVPNPYDHVELITDYKHLKAFLRDVYRFKDPYAIDYETSGLNIHYPGHHIWSMAMSPLNVDTSYAFAIDHPHGWTKEQREELHNIMRHIFTKPRDWVAHNLQYEKPWTRGIFGPNPDFQWCTMIGAHLEDTREGRTGLKLQSFVKYGIYGYDKSSKLFISAPEGEPFNKMHEMPLEDQLFYVGIDTWLTSKLWRTQQNTLSYNIRGAKFFMKSANVLADLSWNGINIDLDYYAKSRKELTTEINEIENKILSSEEVRGFLRNSGRSEININSNDQLISLFVDYLGLQVWKETASGKVSVDAESLEKMNHWIPETIIGLRHLKKIRDNYINQYETVHTNSVLHPAYLLNIAASLRSSSRNPNFQNIPKHKKRAKNICRGGIRPRPGWLILEGDFSGIEVVTSCLYHKDPTFIEYQQNPKADMHRDNCADLWCTTPDNVSKAARAFQKSTWTFPQFYGDYYKNCAKNTWEGRNIEMKDGKTGLQCLEDAGIFTIEAFTDYLEEAERILWEERFEVYTEWKKEQSRIYRRQGYIETYLGYKYKGYLDRKQLANYPIQGTAFHIMLWCLVYLYGIAKKEKWESLFVGEIHDSMILDAVPDEVEHIIKTMKYVCEEVVVNRFDWITMPFRLDLECTKIDGNFSEFYEIDLRKPKGLTITIPKGNEEEKLDIINASDWNQWKE